MNLIHLSHLRISLVLGIVHLEHRVDWDVLAERHDGLHYSAIVVEAHQLPIDHEVALYRSVLRGCVACFSIEFISYVALHRVEGFEIVRGIVSFLD